MAKKKAKLKKVQLVEASTAMSKPSLYIDLEADDLDMLKKHKIGDEIVLVIRGDLTSISQRKDPGDKEASGSISLQDYDVELGDDNVFEKLADDEEDVA